MSEAKDRLIRAAYDVIKEENCEAFQIPLWGDIWAVVGTKDHIRQIIKPPTKTQ